MPVLRLVRRAFTLVELLVVIAGNDTSIMQNPMAGQSQSNLWFGTLEDLPRFGPSSGWGGVWLDDAVEADVPSDPYLFAGYTRRVVHLAHYEAHPVEFTFEFDAAGDGRWQAGETVKVPPGEATVHEFPAGYAAHWVRLVADKPCQETAVFEYR